MSTHTTYDEAKHPRSQDGKFTTKPAGESTTALTTDPLTPQQRALVNAIYEAEYGDPDDSAERIENMGPLHGLDGYDDAAWVAEQLQQGHAPDLAFDYDYSTEPMEVTGYNVGVRLEDGTQWTAYRNTYELTTDPAATGEAAAAGYAESIMGDYQHMRARAVKAGLISDSGNHPGPDEKLRTRIEAALRELDPDEDTWPTGEQVDAIVAATQRQMDDDEDDFGSSRADELSVGDKFIYDGELHKVVSTDGDHKSLSVETEDGQVLELRNDEQVLVQGAYRCQGCGRSEAACSADPCVDVLADREAM